MILILLSLVICASSLSFKDCNASELEFFSHYSLGKQNQLNATFDRLNKDIAALPNITYNSSDLLFRYKIVDAKAQFSYRDSSQTGEVIGDDIIYIKGGKVQTTVSFNYFKNQNQGKGSALCLSDPISFAKLLYMEQGFIKFKVGDYINISYYGRQCNITRLEPPLSPQDISILGIMFNQNDDHNVKNALEAELGSKYADALNSSLYEEKMKISNQSNYTWTHHGKNFTINYTHLPVGGHLQNIGLFMTFVTEITDDERWKCGATVPFSPKDPKAYGGIQEYLSLSVFQNSIRYAIQHEQLNSELNQQNWQSRVFQFCAGDLYEIIPFLAQKYRAAQPISGHCNATTSNLRLAQSEGNRLLLSMHYNCNLKIGNDLINEFDVDPNFIVEIEPNNRYLNFRIVKVNKFAHFKDVGPYKVNDIELANLFLTRGLQRLVGEKVFGSGWPIYPRDYPAIMVEQGVLFIYDKAA